MGGGGREGREPDNSRKTEIMKLSKVPGRGGGGGGEQGLGLQPG